MQQSQKEYIQSLKDRPKVLLTMEPARILFSLEDQSNIFTHRIVNRIDQLLGGEVPLESVFKSERAFSCSQKSVMNRRKKSEGELHVITEVSGKGRGRDEIQEKLRELVGETGFGIGSICTL